MNIFVPSGGWQWAVQAPIMIPVGLELGISPAVTSMAIAWGGHLDEYDTVILSFTSTCCRRAWCKRYYGLLCHHAFIYGFDD